MTVSQLIRELEKYDGTKKVVLDNETQGIYNMEIVGFIDDNPTELIINVRF